MEDAATAAAPMILATKLAVVSSLPADPIAADLEDLRQQQLALRKQREDLARHVKNAKKKVQRLKGRARALSDEDLVAVLMMRKAAAGSKQSSSSSACGSGASTPSASGSAAASVAPTAGGSSEAPTSGAREMDEGASDRERD